MVLKAGGEISDSRIETTPHALKKDGGIRTTMLHEMSSGDLTLNTELYTEGTCGKLAECVRKNPEGNQCSDKEDEDTEKDQFGPM